MSKDYTTDLVKIAVECAKGIQALNGKIKNSDSVEDQFLKMVRPYLVATYGKLLTLYRLLNGYELSDLIPKAKGRSFDHVTPFDTVRSLYENYLQISFILQRYKSVAEKNYIMLLWNIRLYQERFKMCSAKQKSLSKIVKEQALLKKYTDIVYNTYYQQLNDDFKNKYLRFKDLSKDYWPKPSNLYRFCGVHSSQHELLYKMHSQYAHMEPLALAQISELLSTSDGDNHKDSLYHAGNAFPFAVLTLQAFSTVSEEIARLFEGDLKDVYHFAKNKISKERLT